MTQASFITEGFSCPSCVKKIESNVAKMPGVDQVEVMFNAGKVKVSWDESQTPAQQIAKMIEDLGYQVTKVQ